jgi:hypothetical protein
VPEVLSSKSDSAPNAFELTAESYVDRKQPVVSLDIHPLEITHGNKTVSDLNEGFDRFNPLNEALTVPACLGFAKCNNAHRNALPPHRAP